MSAGSIVMDSYGALAVGVVAGPCYYYGRWLLRKLKIDDPRDVIAVHLGCGIWGCVCVGFLANPNKVVASVVAKRFTPDTIKNIGEN